MKVCRLFALLMKWHNSCWTHALTRAPTTLKLVQFWFPLLYICWYFWFFGWHCSNCGHNKEHILRASRRENRFALLLLLLLCTAQQLSRWNRSLALDRLKRYICMHRPICVCAWLSTLLTRRWVGSFHAGLHKENDLWHVIRHAVGQVDAEVNREIYYICLAWQSPKGLKRIMRDILCTDTYTNIVSLRGAFFRVNLPLSDSLC